MQPIVFYCKHVPYHYWLLFWNSNSTSCVLSANPTFSLCPPISSATPVTQLSVGRLDQWCQPQKALQVLTTLPWKISENPGCPVLSLGPHQHQSMFHRGRRRWRLPQKLLEFVCTLPLCILAGLMDPTSLGQH